MERNGRRAARRRRGPDGKPAAPLRGGRRLYFPVNFINEKTKITMKNSAGRGARVCGPFGGV